MSTPFLDFDSPSIDLSSDAAQLFDKNQHHSNTMDATYVSAWAPQQLEHELAYHHYQQDPYRVHIRRLSAQYDPMMFPVGIPDVMQKPSMSLPMLQVPLQHQQSDYPIGWQPLYHTPEEHRHWSPLSRVSSSSGFDNTCSPPSHHGSMSPAMATEVLASMLREQDMYSSPVSVHGAYPGMSATAMSSTGTYAVQAPHVIPSQHFSMRDFDCYSSDGEEPPLIDAEELYANQAYQVPAPVEPEPASSHRTAALKVADEPSVPSLQEAASQTVLSVSVAEEPIPPASTSNKSKARPTSSSKTNPRKHARSPSTASASSEPLQTAPSAKKRRIASISSLKRTISAPTAPTTKSKPLLPCPFHAFACPAVFPSKNEWKRHTLSQHLRLGFYRCSLGSCAIDHPSGVTQARGYNDFNRKDLFVQHLRRMHADECPGIVAKDEEHQAMGVSGRRKTSKAKSKKGKAGRKTEDAGELDEAWLEQVRREAWISVRLAPGGDALVGCGFCKEKFGCRLADAGESDSDDDGSDAESSADHRHPRKRRRQQKISHAITGEEGKGADVAMWEKRMEHVAAHYASGAKVEDEVLDEGFKNWAINQRLVVWSGSFDGSGSWVLREIAEGVDTAGHQGVVGRDYSHPYGEHEPAKTGGRRKGKNSLAKHRAQRGRNDTWAMGPVVGANGSGVVSDPGTFGAVARKSERLLVSGTKRKYVESDEEDEDEVSSVDDQGSWGRNKRVKIKEEVVVQEDLDEEEDVEASESDADGEDDY
ncbi:uncharacterized protein AB675_2514 [Cyphellophora attinorum]|uniref:C2H2-type domain-containing protein n=1 Tax=Cyphellophora attinorum TaxID=1664694 RepID=A0A0N1HAF5_9EURO|nr:uncharacterized protein AB675_2514 [Phialophora attinorum]KPI44897.1 hypothetical protein AB675_2514 [Phialophora attinorum]